MDVKEIMIQLESLADEKRRKHNMKWGAGENQFGVKLGDLRKIAKKLKKNHALSKELWATKNEDARLLSILIVEPEKLSSEDLTSMINDVNYTHVSDWFNSYVMRHHPERLALREPWIASDKGLAARTGWQMTSQMVRKNEEGFDLGELLSTLEEKMPHAPYEVQWTMNFVLAEIGINHAEYRAQALEVGERLGIFKEYKAPKACTSPYAPIWINEMVSRQSKTVK